MSKLWEKLGDAKDNSDLREVDITRLRIAGPTVIYFPGKDQADNNPTELSKGVHFMDKLFTDLTAPPKVYIYSHSSKYAKFSGNLTSLFRVAVYSHLPGFASSAGRKMAKNLVLPLVTDTNGKPLPADIARQNLRQLTFVGYCLGSVTAQEVHNNSMKLMRKAGYSKQEARDLLREIVLVSFATFTRPPREADRYTTLAFTNTDDFFVNTKNILVTPVTSLLRTGIDFATLTTSGQLRIKQLSESSVAVTAAARQNPLRSIFWRKAKKNADDVTLPHWNPRASNHEARDYINAEDASNQFARMVKYGLLNAVSRDGSVKPLELLNEPQHIKTPGYASKIINGLRRGKNRPSLWKKLPFVRGHE